MAYTIQYHHVKISPSLDLNINNKDVNFTSDGRSLNCFAPM